MKILLLVIGLAAIIAISFIGCSLVTDRSGRLTVDTTYIRDLDNAMMVASLTESKLEVRDVVALQDEARQLFTAWLRDNKFMSGGSEVRVTFLGRAMSNGQRMAVDYPRISVRLEGVRP